MKTRGLEISEYGSLLVPATAGVVPLPFWSRLKRLITLAGLLEEFQAQYRAGREQVSDAGFPGFADAMEITLFRYWVGRVGQAPALWPWDRGWTEDAVDSYLTDGGGRPS